MLIRTKLEPPRNSFNLVARPGLIEKFDASAARKLTLVCAPAGFGKTTAVVSWLERRDVACAWFSLDETDNDLVTFLRYLVGAIRSTAPGTCENSLQLIQGSELPGVDTMAATILGDLDSVSRPCILILDDYHLIHDVEIHDLMRLLVSRLPADVHLLLITRIDPPLPLPRLRVLNQLVELRGKDFRFSDQDAHQFLVENGQHSVSVEAAGVLNQQFDGWVAGLRLASLALEAEGRHDGHLANPNLASGQLLSEYLFDEVLEHQPPDVQDLLLKTSLLDRFSPSLCSAMLSDSGAHLVTDMQEMLDELARMNLFFITVDDVNGWHRYHHLFQRILQQRLMAQVSKAEIEALHRRAAVWFAETGYPDEALTHALAAGDLDLAVDLVERHCRNFLNGLERNTLERWMDGLPEEVVWQRPTLLMAKAWMLYRHWRLTTLDRVLCTLALLLAEQPIGMTADKHDLLTGQMLALRSATNFHVHMDFRRSLTDVKEAMEHLPDSEGGALSTALIHGMFSELGIGEYDRPDAELMAIIHDPAPAGPAKAQLFLGIVFAHFMSGNMDRLGQIGKQMLRAMPAKSVASGAESWTAGLRAFELDRLDEAFEAHEIMYQARHRSNYVGGFYAGYALVRIWQLRKEYDNAQSMLSDLYTDTARLDNAQFLEELDAYQAHQWLLTGENDAALRWALAHNPADRHDSMLAFDPPNLCWARILSALGTTPDKEKAHAFLVSYLADIALSRFTRRKVQLLAHLASICADLKKNATADEYLQEALALGQPLGLIRSLADAGPSLMPVLQRLLGQALAPAYILTILDAIPNARTSNRTMKTSTLLTRREQEVLGLMRTGQSNQEIADRLVISVHTVKRHGTNIFMKLAVDNRQEAIYRATELGILT